MTKKPLKAAYKSIIIMVYTIPEVFPVVQKIICWGTWDFYYTYQIIVNSLGIGFRQLHWRSKAEQVLLHGHAYV